LYPYKEAVTRLWCPFRRIGLISRALGPLANGPFSLIFMDIVVASCWPSDQRRFRLR